MADLVDSFLEYEKTFARAPVVEWFERHTEVPIFAVALYLVLVFYVPHYISSPINLKIFLAAWNLLLSVFSIFGAIRTVPSLIGLLQTGFVHSVCSTPFWLDGPSGVWVMVFIFSKFFELLDTFFLVMRKRKVIFLHWFHHVTVLLFCWHAYMLSSSYGLWFASMNFCVHSVMYFYYFLMLFRSIRSSVTPFAPFITTIQISQMVVGLVVSAVAGMNVGMNRSDSCHVDPANWKLGLAMYFSYFALFVSLFYKKFISKVKRKTPDAVCQATDGAGMFRGQNSSRGKNANLQHRNQRPQKSRKAD